MRSKKNKHVKNIFLVLFIIFLDVIVMKKNVHEII